MGLFNTRKSSKQEEPCEFCIEVQRQSEMTEGKDYSITFRGKVILATCGAITLGTVALAVPFLAPGLRRICLPYLPASDIQIRNVFSVMNSQKGKLIDIGSGDGRIVIEAAKHGYTAVGVELNRWLVYYSRYKAWREGVHRKTCFIRKDLFTINYKQCDHVVVFGVEYLMPSLEEKLLAEVQPHCELVACRFPFPSLTKIASVGDGVDAVWKYSAVKRPTPSQEKDCSNLSQNTDLKSVNKSNEMSYKPINGQIEFDQSVLPQSMFKNNIVDSGHSDSSKKS